MKNYFVYSCGPKRFEHAETRRLVGCLKSLYLYCRKKRLCNSEIFWLFSSSSVIDIRILLLGCWEVLNPTRKETSKCFCQNGVNFLRRLALQEKKKNLMTARVSLLKSRASLTCFQACSFPGRAKDLSAPRYGLNTLNRIRVRWGDTFWGDRNVCQAKSCSFHEVNINCS